MPANTKLLQSCFRQAGDHPAGALVRLWLHLRDQRNLEGGPGREAREQEAARIQQALETERPTPLSDPAALLRAVDHHLSAADLGREPRVRRVELAPRQGGGNYLVIPRRARWASRLSYRQPGHVEYWMRRHHVAPAEHRGISVTIRRPADKIWRAFDGAATAFAAGGFVDGVLPGWNDRAPYRCSTLANGEQRWASLEALLCQAADNEARVLVLPELTVDADVRTRLRAWLRETRGHPFELVVAGSFHEELTGGDGAGPIRRSVARVLDAWGEELTAHVKLRPMRATGEDGSAIDEDLVGGHRVELLLLPVGLLGIGICLDFCETGDTPVTDLWRAVGPALMLVPSMGSATTNTAHGAKARVLALHHATLTVVASQHPDRPESRGLAWQPNLDDGPAVHADEDQPVLYGRLLWTMD